MRAFLAVLVLLAVPATAHAGRSQYGWLYGSEVLPERGVEVQTWVYEKNGRTDTNIHETSMWWGALVGVTDNFELVFPVEFLWLKADASPATFTVEKFGVEARYRFVKTDPEKPDGVAPLLRLALKRDVTVRDVAILEADFVTSYQSGRFHGLLDLGVTGRISSDGDNNSVELRPGFGIAIETKKDLRFGAEFYAELPLDSNLKQLQWAAVGPNMAWTHGRFWLSASFLIGLYQIDTAPRVIWGILF
ncbi:MAG: hypothetical protein ABI867_21175 [Kofleriaceae bacterium]